MSDATDAEKLRFVDPKLADFFQRLKPQFAAQFPGSSITVGQGYRTPRIQQDIHLSGASVFNGKTSFSLHQYFPSRALDILVIDGGQEVGDGRDPRYTWIGEEAEGEGFVWGGRFLHPSPDYDHIQLPGTPNPTPVQVAEGINAYQQATGA
jgi:hypothetical protein